MDFLADKHHLQDLLPVALLLLQEDSRLAMKGCYLRGNQDPDGRKIMHDSGVEREFGHTITADV